MKYYIGVPEKRTVLSVAHDIGMAPGKDISQTLVHVQDRVFKDQRYHIDCSKLHALGWKPKFSWKDGLKETTKWYVENNESSAYWGNFCSSVQEHTADLSQGNVFGEVYSTLRTITRDKMQEEEEEHQEEQEDIARF